MSTDPDVTRVVRSWLEMGAIALPDRVLDQVLDQVPATPQRRSRWPARRLNEMNTPLKLAITAAAVAVVLVAAIGITGMPGAGGVGGSPAVLPPTALPTPLPPPSAAPATPSVTATAAPTAASTASPAAVDLGWPGSRVGPAGRYSWDPDGRAASIARPNGGTFGWMHNNGSHLLMTIRQTNETYGPGLMAVTVGGYSGTYQEYPVNSKDVLERHVWIIDVESTPVTVVVEIRPGASAADRAEAMAVIESIRVEPTTSKTGFKLAFDLLSGWDSG